MSTRKILMMTLAAGWLASGRPAHALYFDGGWEFSFQVPSQSVTGGCRGLLAEVGASLPVSVSTSTPLDCVAYDVPSLGTVYFDATLSGSYDGSTLALSGSATSLCSLSISLTGLAITPSGSTAPKVSFSGSFACNSNLTGTFAATRACGDGTLDSDLGEQCDDGNLAEGDCCSSSCQLAGNGSLCADEGNECTADLCFNGVCQHDIYGNWGAPCDDGNVCTANDTCANGACVPGGPPTTCETAAPAKALVQIAANIDPAKGKFKWKWRSAGAFDVTALGSPDSTDDVVVCAFDQSGLKFQATATAGGTCAGKPCWTVAAGKVKYRDSEATPDGLTKLDAKSGAAGKGKLQAQGQGLDLTLPSLPLIPPVTVHAVRADGSACWQSTFSTPIKNEPGKFTAKSDAAGSTTSTTVTTTPTTSDTTTTT